MINEVEKMTVEELEVAERLRPHWIEVVQEIGGNLENADEAFEEIARRYRTGDGRSYHNLFHSFEHRVLISFEPKDLC